MTHEQMRQEVWLRVWAAVASTEEVKKTDVPTFWADKALAAFDERFRAPKPVTVRRRGPVTITLL